jgi:hypothetical protein
MSDFRFTVLEVVAEPYAMAPQLTAGGKQPFL